MMKQRTIWYRIPGHLLSLTLHPRWVTCQRPLPYEALKTNAKQLFCVGLLDKRKSNALFQSSKSPPACPSDHTSNKTQMNMQHWWNDTDRRKQKYWERNLSQWRFVHHKSHTDLVLNPGFRSVRPETNRLSHDLQPSALHITSAYLAVNTSRLCYEDQIVYAHCNRQTDHIEHIMWAECWIF